MPRSRVDVGYQNRAMLHALIAAALVAGAAPVAAAAPARQARPTGRSLRPAALPPAAPPTLRLLATARPIRGVVELTVDPTAERYRGTVHYQVALGVPTTTLWLHAEELLITGATLGGRPARPVTAPGGLLGLVVDRPAAAGKTELVVEFSGSLDRARWSGIHAAAEGDRWYAYAFPGIAAARRAFPCFDEPGFKIPWHLALRVKPGDRAVAGTPVALETAEPGYTRLDFEETAPLPAGQVAFAVGPFELVDAGVGGAAAVPIHLVVPRGRGREARLAAEVVPRILAALEAEVGRPYPYRKCDVVAVPRHGWSLGHPGLAALDQAVALVPPTEETRERREALVGLAGQELAHHWYGGLVTPAWWDEAWLGESFAAWEGAGATERLEPGWRALATARSAWRAAGLGADARPSARRVRQPIRSRLDLEAALEQAPTHDKGAALLTMFEAFLGRERFRAVVKAHLDARAHGVAASDDFLAALSAAAGPQVAVSLRSFLDQPGAPILKATASCGRGGARVTLTQERFLETGARDRTGRWTVPICLRAGAAARETTVCGLVGGPRAELPLPFCPEWIWPNAGGTGYYLTALAPAELPRQLPHLTTAEKLALLTDLTLLSRRGDLGIADALGLVDPLAREPDRLLVASSVSLAGLIDPSRLGDADLAPWRGWVRRTWGERARALGWLPRPGDDDEARALRRQLVPLVAGPGEEAVLAGEALALARRWLADRRQVPAEVAWPALAVAARRGDQALLDRVVAELARTTDRTERARLLGALGSFEDPPLARGALAALAGPGAEPREVAALLERQLGGRTTRAAAWRQLVERWPTLAPRLLAEDANGLVAAAARVACDPGRRGDVVGFLGPRVAPLEGAPSMLRSALEEADACASARSRNQRAISSFLARAAAP